MIADRRRVLTPPASHALQGDAPGFGRGELGYRLGMTDKETDTVNDQTKDHVADRLPTPEEEAAAEQARDGVDLDKVGAEFEEMAELGADVRGEGQIEPDA
jgi:hypothetical protein